MVCYSESMTIMSYWRLIRHGWATDGERAKVKSSEVLFCSR